MQLGASTSANMEGLVRCKTSATTSTRMGVALRFTASNTFYHARLSANANNLVIGKVVTGTNTDLFTTAFTVSIATFYWIRFRVVGTNLYARVWADGGSEPGTWTLTGTDSSITGAGGFGLTINASSTAVTWDFDSFTVTDATTTVVFPMRAVIATQNTKLFKLRAPISTQNTKLFKLRAVLSNNSVTKLFKLRVPIRTLNTKLFQLRAKVFGQNTKLFKIRTRIQTQNTALFKLRARLSITSTKLFKLRTVLKTQNTTLFQMRVITKAPPIQSGGFALLANTAIGSSGVQFANLRATQYPDPALNLAPVLPRLGSSSASWNATIPTNTTLGVKTSLDAVTWSTATSGASISGLNGQPDPTIDLWTSNTLANYTNTSKSGGSATTVTYDTTNSRISLVGGSGGVYLNTAISSADIDLICDMDRSDAGGLVWRYIDASNYYELGCYDDSASGGFTNALRLYKVASGTRSLLGTASVISWPRATPATSPYKRTRVIMLGAIITVYFDGVQMQTYTDGSPLAAGKCGLRNDGGTSRYYQIRIQPQGDYVGGTPAGDFSTSDFVYTQVTMTTSDPSVTPSLQDLTTSARSPQIATGALITQLHDPSKPFASFYNVEMGSLTQTSGDYWWNVNSSDNPGALIFNKREAIPAPFCLHSSDLLLTPTGASASTVQPTASADLYRNQQIITNCIDTVAISGEQKIADGTATSWGLKYPLYSAPTITVQGVVKTVGVKGVDTGKDFYWQAANNTISQDSGATKIPSGYVMSFSYVGQFDTIVTRDNLAEQAARALIESQGGTVRSTGIVAAIEDGKGMLASNAIVYADGLLARYGNNNTVELVAATLRSGLEEGMLLPVFLPEHQLHNEQLLIVKLTTTAVLQADGTALYQYEIDATNGPNLSNWSAALGI